MCFSLREKDSALFLTSKISSRLTSMRQWPAWGWCWESSCRRIFSFCTRSLLYLGTVRHSASSGNWAGDRACWGPPGATCSFNWVGWLKEVRWSVENRRKGEEHGNRWREGMKEKQGGKKRTAVCQYDPSVILKCLSLDVLSWKQITIVWLFIQRQRRCVR